MKSFSLVIVNALLALAGAAIAVFTVKDLKVTNYCYTHLSYYFVLATFILWACITVGFMWQRRPDLRSFLSRYAPLLILAAILCSVIFLSVKPALRILNDEANLV